MMNSKEDEEHKALLAWEARTARLICKILVVVAIGLGIGVSIASAIKGIQEKKAADAARDASIERLEAALEAYGIEVPDAD